MIIKQPSHFNFFILVVTLVTALGGFTLGFDAGFAVDGKDQITSQFDLSNLQWSFIACISIAGSLVATPVSGRFVDKHGSKNLLLLSAIGFIARLSF